MIYYLSKEQYKYVKISFIKWFTVLSILLVLSFMIGKSYGESQCLTKKETNDTKRID
jgi:hypothetical protein